MAALNAPRVAALLCMALLLAVAGVPHWRASALYALHWVISKPPPRMAALPGLRTAWEKRHIRLFPGRSQGHEEPHCDQILAAGGFVTETRGQWVSGVLAPKLAAQGKLEAVEIGTCGHPMRWPAGVRLRTLDFDADPKRLRRECGVGALPDIVDDAQRLATIPSASLDAIAGNHVLEHITNFLDAVRSWVRVVKPGGHVIFALPSMCKVDTGSGDWLRLAPQPQHFIDELNHPERASRHDEEVAVFRWGFLQAKKGRAKASLDEMEPAELDANARAVHGKPGKGHVHIWTVRTLCDTLRLARHHFPPELDFEVATCEESAAENNPFRNHELRVCLRRTGKNATQPRAADR
jgi:SAM-dependent methyltransferase